jgi:predicted Zn-dependent peptidase
MGESAPDRMLNFEKYVNTLKPADVQAAAKLVTNAPSKIIAVLKPGQ